MRQLPCFLMLAQSLQSACFFQNALDSSRSSIGLLCSLTPASLSLFLRSSLNINVTWNFTLLGCVLRFTVHVVLRGSPKLCKLYRAGCCLSECGARQAIG